MTGVGLLVLAIRHFLVTAFAIDVDQDTLTKAVVGLVDFVSYVWIIYGQIRRDDLRWGLWRKWARK